MERITHAMRACYLAGVVKVLLPNHNDWKMLIKLSHYCLI